MPARQVQPRRAHAAFTLVEVMAAVFVLAFAFGSTFAVMQRALLVLDNARTIEAAGAILQSEMEKERMFTWDQAASTTYQPAVDAGFTRDPAVAGRFTLTRTVTPMTGRETRLLQITLTATWSTRDGIAHSRRFTTYYGLGGLYAYVARTP